MKLLFIPLVVLLFLFTFQSKVMALQGAVSVSSGEAKYDLPYPGVLPDSPWYFFKVIRDNVTLFLVRKQPEKAFYEVFLADKRMAAAQALFARGKFPLAAVTAMKAEEYLRSVVEGGQFRGKDKDNLAAKIVVSQIKHREIIREILQKYSSRETTKAWDDNEFVHNRIMNVLISIR